MPNTVSGFEERESRTKRSSGRGQAVPLFPGYWEMGRLLLNYVLSDSYVYVALVGMREPRFVYLNNAISDDVESWLDLAQVHERYVH